MSKPTVVDFSVEQVLFSLATNVDNRYLHYVSHYFVMLGEVCVSDIYQSIAVDMHNNTYHNQILWLNFTLPVFYQDLLSLSKQLEQQHDRQNFAKPLVSLDIDIIAVKTQNVLNTQKDEKNQTFIKLENNWYGIARRLPLVDYDKICYDNLCQKILQTLSQPISQTLPNLL